MDGEGPWVTKKKKVLKIWPGERGPSRKMSSIALAAIKLAKSWIALNKPNFKHYIVVVLIQKGLIGYWVILLVTGGGRGK